MLDLNRLRNVGIGVMPGDRLWIRSDGSCGREGVPLIMGNAFLMSEFLRANGHLGWR